MRALKQTEETERKRCSLTGLEEATLRVRAQKRARKRRKEASYRTAFDELSSGRRL